MNRITLDHTNMMAGAVEGGITEECLARFMRSATKALNRLKGENLEGRLGFMYLPCKKPSQVVKMAEEAGGRGFSDFVVVGIGGSSLGAKAIADALAHPYWNLLSTAERNGRPRVFFLENVDPSAFSATIGVIDLENTLFNIVSKSGKTLETVSQFLIVKELLEKACGSSWREHVVITTDPEKGPLREIAEEEGIESLSIPQEVGGRFSVLSPAGLFPAAMMGIDVNGLLDGASEIAAFCVSENITENIALALCAYYLTSYEKGKPITVLMPYSERLWGFAMWFRQLWAESLGKRKPGGGCVGLTPAVALGTQDQHSQLQLFMDGPDDKTITFIRVENEPHDSEIPKSIVKEDFKSLYGSTLGELLLAELAATRDALARRGRSSVTISLSAISPETIGAIFFLYEMVTVYMGYMLGINPFDQPGVELGKSITRQILEGGAELLPAETHLIECVL
jgi:glucose-6-phosphate isomerase